MPPRHRISRLPRRKNFSLQPLNRRLFDVGSIKLDDKTALQPKLAEDKRLPAAKLAPTTPLNLNSKLEATDQSRLISQIPPAAKAPLRIFSRVSRPPYIRSCSKKAEKLINNWWCYIFHDPKLRGLAGDHRVKPPSSSYGLIYRYVVAGRVRYIGITTEDLYRRMTRLRKGGKIGYPIPIKRNLLNAYRNGTLKIKTEVIRKTYLHDRERKLILHFAPAKMLWNKEHNPYFELSDYDR